MSRESIVRFGQVERIELEELIWEGKAAANKIKHAHIPLNGHADPDDPGKPKGNSPRCPVARTGGIWPGLHFLPGRLDFIPARQ